MDISNQILMQPVAQFNGRGGVQIFFVISGFRNSLFSRKSESLRFFVSRSTRLLPAALVCATITLVIVGMVDTIPESELIAAYFRSISFWPQGPWIDDSYWTLAIEVAFYAMVFGLLIVKRFNWINRLAIFVGLLSIAFNLMLLLSQDVNAMHELRGKRIGQLLLLHHGAYSLWAFIYGSGWSKVPLGGESFGHACSLLVDVFR